MANEHRDEEESPRPRPRVVDKRGAARRAAGEDVPTRAPEPAEPETAAEPEPEPAAPPSDEGTFRPPPQAAEEAGAPGQVWTPEQEEQARRLVEVYTRTPALDMIVQVATELVNVAGVKIDGRDLPGAQLAIDALGGIVDGLGARLGEAENPLRQLRAQLQMAYAEAAGAPPPPGGNAPSDL